MNLQMEIGKSSKYPSKKTINLAMKDKKTASTRNIVVTCVAIVVVVVLVLKFGVLDQLARLDAAEAAYKEVHAQNEEYKAALEGYDDVLREYRLYSRDWYSEENGIEPVSRQDILDMVETQLMTKGIVKNINVSGNVCTVEMSGMTLEEISAMFDQLKLYPIVESALLNLAESVDSEGKYADFKITINLKTTEEVEE